MGSINPQIVQAMMQRALQNAGSQIQASGGQVQQPTNGNVPMKPNIVVGPAPDFQPVRPPITQNPIGGFQTAFNNAFPGQQQMGNNDSLGQNTTLAQQPRFNYGKPSNPAASGVNLISKVNTNYKRRYV